MSVKATRELRVGCGRYVWRFQAREPLLVSRLQITIEAMLLLPPSVHEIVYGWAGRLPYPWCPSADDLAAGPIGSLLRRPADPITCEH
jgi:hypothetical protein